jgi:rhamnose utilization protein RhaD (predicted bifunctional aldolase and dehydrogenase)
MGSIAPLDDLRRFSARIGKNIHLVQGGGGNTSVKVDDTLWVKASGAWLADAESREIFVPVRLSGARRAIAAGNEHIPAAEGFTGILRASIETSLHALMPHRVVVHVHAVNTVAWAVRTDSREKLAKRLRGLAWHFLTYHRPGLPLCQAVAACMAAAPADVFILGNHGLLVGAEDGDAAESLIEDVERRLAVPLRAAPETRLSQLDALCTGTGYQPATPHVAHGLATDSRNLRLVTAGSLYPDHVVFLGPALPAIRNGESMEQTIAREIDKGLAPPVALLVPGAGAIIRTDASEGAKVLLHGLGLVAERLPERTAIVYLPASEERMLLDWNAEHYRKQMAASR